MTISKHQTSTYFGTRLVATKVARSKNGADIFKKWGFPVWHYLNTWRRRNALKMWSGWPTFPMVFVKGVLVGGADDMVKLIASGELKKMLG